MKTGTKTLLGTAAVLILTIVHHFYGAAIYATPWRYHVAFIVIPMLVLLTLTFGMHRLFRTNQIGRPSLYLFISVAFVVGNNRVFRGRDSMDRGALGEETIRTKSHERPLLGVRPPGGALA